MIGRVGDEFSGFAGMSVTVNGVPASVNPGGGNDGTFSAPNISINPSGQTTLTVVATDAVGNQRTTSVNVSYFVPTSNDFVMEAVGGDGQSGRVLTTLTQPLTVRLKKPDGSPLASKLVTFDVTRSDGQLRASLNGAPGINPLKLQVFTNASGIATAYWRLGSDAGSGNNRVSVTSQDLVGSTFFSASGTPAPADRIVVGDHNYQKAQAGAQLFQPLRVFVTDGDSGNGVGNVPVIFTVTKGDGMFMNGDSTITLPTDATGHVDAGFYLGLTPGENVIEATFDGNPGLPATFIATGLERNDSAPTTLEGTVEDNAGRAIGGALITMKTTLQFASGPSAFTLGPKTTDVNGKFVFTKADLPPNALDTDLPAGPCKMLADARNPVTLNGVAKPVWSFPYVGYEMMIVKGAVNSLPTPVYLPEMDPRNEVVYDGTKDVILKMAGVDGLEFKVKAGSLTRENNTRPSPADPEVLRLNQVHFDKVPMALPDGTAFPLAWTLQPKNARFNPPIEVTLPNIAGLPPGSTTTLVQWNNDTASFQTMGTAKVAADGSVLKTDPGSGITVAGWGGAQAPPQEQREEKNCARTSVLDQLKTVIKLSADLILAIADVNKWLKIAYHALGAVEDCVSAFNAIRDSGAVDCAKAAAVSQCISSTLETIGDAIDSAPQNPVRLVQRAQQVASTIGAATSAAIDSGCVKGFAASIALHAVQTLANYVESMLGWSANMSAKQALLSVANQKAQLIADLINSNCAGRQRGPNEELPPEVLAQLDTLFVELQAAMAQSSAFDSAIEMFNNDSATPASIQSDAQSIVESVSSPQIAGCRVTLAGITVKADESGGFQFANIPVSNRLIRAIVECGSAPAAMYSVSDYFLAGEGSDGALQYPFVLSSTPPAMPRELQFAPTGTVVSPGVIVQLTVNGTMSDGTTASLTTKAKGTTYQSTDPRVAAIDSNGLLTAISDGTAFIAAMNEGVTTTRRVDVATTTFQSTVTGIVLLPNGQPAVGAAITSPSFGGAALTDSLGFFSLALTVPAWSTSITISANLTAGTSPLTGASGAVAIAPQATVDAGLIRIDAVHSPIFPQPAFPTGISPSSVAIGDLDGDGKPDLAVANFSDNTVSILRNTGNSTFVDMVTKATGTNPQSVAIGDFDRDGRADIVVTNYGNSTVSVLRNTGNGTFADKVDYPTGSQPYVAAVGDLDGDHNPDLAVANYRDWTVSVLLNTGNGTFSAAENYFCGAQPQCLAIGDLDGDGKPDLAVGNDYGLWGPMWNNGSGTFTKGNGLSCGFNLYSVAIGDLDGDGKPDIAFADQTGGTRVVRNNGNRNFAAVVFFGSGSQPTSVAMGDLDGDGRPELAVANYGSNTISVLQNTSPGGGIVAFAAPVNYDAGLGAYSVAIGDLDGDGKPDLAAANQGSSTVSVLRNTGDCRYEARVDFATGSGPRVSVGDLDGDGKPDLVVANYNSNTVSVYRNSGSGTFSPWVELTAGRGPRRPAIGDLDGDGRPDLVVANYLDNTMSVFRNLGIGGAFAPKANYQTGSNPISVEIGDIDNDGKPDLVVSNVGAATVSSFKNKGDGTFAGRLDYPTGGGPRAAMADLNGDGWRDIAVANFSSNLVTILMNTGNGTFVRKGDYPAGSNAAGLRIGDLDGDGNPDLAVWNTDSNTVSVLRNLGSGTFLGPVSYATGRNPGSVNIGDLDGDGMPDLVVTNGGSNSLSFLRNNGNGTFASRVEFATGRTPNGAPIVDFDGDGKPDLAVSNFDSNTVSILRNQSSGGLLRRTAPSRAPAELSRLFRALRPVRTDQDALAHAANTRAPSDSGMTQRGSVQRGTPTSKGTTSSRQTIAPSGEAKGLTADASVADTTKPTPPNRNAIAGIVEGEVTTALGTLGGGQSFVNAVTQVIPGDDASTIAIGWSETPDGWRAPFLWTKATGMRPLREFVHPQDLAFLPDGSSEAVSIDAFGRVSIRISRPGVECAPTAVVRVRLTPDQRADIDGDGFVTLQDLMILRAMGSGGISPSGVGVRNLPCDINLDGRVDENDVAEISSRLLAR
ncbi:MAG: FG-GAP-like repeat-containing protein [Phycisphaerales bacterium]